MDDYSNNYLVVVPEIFVSQAALACEPNNHFEKLLQIAQEYKEAGMVPFFLYDPLNGKLGVYTEETYNKTLH